VKYGPSPPPPADVAIKSLERVYPYYGAGKLAEIYEYRKRDVETARQVYRRLTFAKNP